MTGIIKNLGRAFGVGRNTGTKARSCLTVAAIAGLAGLTLAAAPASYAGEGDRYYRQDRDNGRDWRNDRDHDRRDDRDNARVGVRADDFGVGVNIRIGEPAARRERVWVEPVYRTVSERVWVEPVYRDEPERIWVEPVYQTVSDRVWVPARVEVRHVERVDHHGRVYHERVEQVVAPGHFEEVHRHELVSPGHWEERPHRVLVTAGYFKTIERQELVSAGHWEWRTIEGRRDASRSEFGVYARSRN